jgi:D-sedoheptulose 7-phosphate isomerase
MNIRENVEKSLREGAELRLALIEQCGAQIVEAGQALCRCFQNGGKVLLFGNGGSAADAQHIAAEFVGRFVKERIPLPAIALTTDTSALTAIGNDYGYGEVFARQVRGLGNAGDVAIGISTSGRSPSILAGIKAARERGLITVGLTGAKGEALASLVDITLMVPSTCAARIQECHLAIEHILCEIVEDVLFD